MAKKRDSQTVDLYKKEIPTMPEGYYSGDKPNPILRTFVEQHIKERSYDPATDNYFKKAFVLSHLISTERPLQRIHGYWTKKPYEAIQDYIFHYTEPNDLVLDPFCGSGSTALAAMFSNRKSIAIDVSPSATFISRHYCTPIDFSQTDRLILELLNRCYKKAGSLYTVTCPHCLGSAEVVHIWYSECYQCLKCMQKIPIYFSIKKNIGKVTRYLCNFCGEEELDITGGIKDYLPVKIELKCMCKKRNFVIDPPNMDGIFDKILKLLKPNMDLANFLLDTYWIPKNKYPRHTLSHRLASKNIRHINQLYTPLNAAGLAVLLDTIEEIQDSSLKLFFKGHFSSLVNGLSRMARDTRTSNVGTFYYCPMVSRQTNVFQYFKKRYEKDVRTAFSIINNRTKTNQIIISTQSATNLSAISQNSVDYVFTDPPYGGKVPYGELNLNWEFWLRMSSEWIDQEIIVNRHEGKSESEWTEMMRKALSEIFRVLKPGRWMTLCYHDTSDGTWYALQELLSEIGFIPDASTKAVYIETREKAYKKKKDDENVQKRDLVINFRKPKPGEVTSTIDITGDEDKTTFNEKVHRIIHDYIGANPGCPKDRIFDEVVSRMVRRGQMESHDFENLLKQIAEEVKTPVMKNLFEQKDADLFGTHEVGRWFLKETEIAEADAAETVREDTAAEKISAFINECLKKQPGDEGVHYSDLFENYVYAVKDKPRRQLAEFLPDYFYKTEQGTWRLPASEEEERAKREARAKGLGRRVKRYIAQLEQGVAIPDNERPNDATLAEWIRHCKRAGLYDQGKHLYERGGLILDNLPEEAMVNVEEDYQVCVRMIARTGGAGIESKPKRGRKAHS